MFGTGYLLFSPGTNYVKRFLGTNTLDEPNWGFVGGSDLTSTTKFVRFVSKSIADPVAILWTAYVICFLLFYYAAVVWGLGTYLQQHLMNVWTLYILGAGGFAFLLGPVGSSRYRFVVIQAFLPIACLGFTRWLDRRQARKAPTDADAGALRGT